MIRLLISSEINSILSKNKIFENKIKLYFTVNQKFLCSNNQNISNENFSNKLNKPGFFNFLLGKNLSVEHYIIIDKIDEKKFTLIYNEKSFQFFKYFCAFAVFTWPIIVYFLIEKFNKSKDEINLDEKTLTLNKLLMIIVLHTFNVLLALKILKEKVLRIYYNSTTKSFKVITPEIFFIKNKFNVKKGEAIYRHTGNKYKDFLKSNTIIKSLNKPINVDESLFTKPLYYNLFYGNSK